MGRGDNRRSMKMKRRIAWRKLKARLRRRLEEAKANPGAAKKKATAKAD